MHQIIDLYDLIFDDNSGPSTDFPFVRTQPVSGDGFANSRDLPAIIGFVDIAILSLQSIAGASLSGPMSEARKAWCIPFWQQC